MPPFDYEKARQFLAERELQRQEKLHDKFLRAQDDCKKIIDLIIKNYHPKRIYQWGSLLNEKFFREYSDIDIALEGVTRP